MSPHFSKAEKAVVAKNINIKIIKIKTHKNRKNQNT